MIFLISLLVIIIVHEAGHLIAAKLCKCGVEIYAIGFGKTLWQKKIGSTVYQINCIPFGGFCKLKGELDYSRSKTAFTNKRYSQKVFIALAGIGVNVLTGLPAYFLGLHYQITWLYAFGMYSLLIGLSNALPIPALDGSYPFWFLLEKKLGKKRTYALMRKVFGISFIILMILNFLSIPWLIQLIASGKLL